MTAPPAPSRYIVTDARARQVGHHVEAMRRLVEADARQDPEAAACWDAAVSDVQAVLVRLGWIR